MIEVRAMVQTRAAVSTRGGANQSGGVGERSEAELTPPVISAPEKLRVAHEIASVPALLLLSTLVCNT